jgi:hypothetical protein
VLSDKPRSRRHASEVGAALKYATVKIAKVRRDTVPIPDDPWAAQNGGPVEEPPF